MDGVFNSIELAGTSAAEKNHDYKILFGVAIAAVAVMGGDLRAGDRPPCRSRRDCRDVGLPVTVARI